MHTPFDGRGLPRRRVLRALALAPAALAGCAAGRAAAVAAPASGEAVAPARPARGAAVPAVAAVRAFRLPADAEPASVFHAAGVRPGEPR
jgi:hypothetical protein